MKLYAALCLVVLGGCAAARTAQPPSAPAADSRELSEARDLSEPVRLETRAGTFLVQPGNAEDLARALAGEPTQHSYFAGDL